MTTLIPKINFKNGGATPTGATTRSIDSKLEEIVSVLDFGADPTGVADSSTAFQNAINYAVSQGVGVFSNGQGLGCKIVSGVVGGQFKILTQVLVCSGLEIDMQGSQLVGAGYGSSDNHCFTSATVVSGSLVANSGSTPLTNLISCL